MPLKTYLVLVKGPRVGGKCAFTYTDEYAQNDQVSIETIQQPKIPWVKKMPFDEWMSKHYAHIEQIAEYLITNIVAYDPNLVVSLTASTHCFKKSLAYYIYCNSENASRSYKFFK